MYLRHKIIFIIVFSILTFSWGFALPYGNSFFNTPLVHAQFFDIGGDAGGFFFDLTPIVDVGGDAGIPIVDPTPIVDIGGDAGVLPIVDIGGDAGTPIVDIGGDAGTPVVDIGGDAGTPIVDIGGDAGGTIVDIGGDAGTPIVDIGGDAGTPSIPVVEDTPIVPLFIPVPLIPLVILPVPTCVSFSASPSSFAFGGGFSLLSWETVAATSVSIDNGIGAVLPIDSGFILVSVTVATNYTLTVSGPGGQTTCEAGVSVGPPPLSATIRVNKVVINDDGGTKVIADFPLLVDTTAVISGVVNTFIPGTYTVTETNQPGYAATFSGDCSATGTLTITAGQNKVCTITNNDIAVPPLPATIRVNKVVINDDGGTKVIADFPLLIDTTAVTSGVVNTFIPGTYTVTETNQPGYAATFSGDCSATGTLTITAGQNKVCTITNNDIAVVVTPPSSPSSSSSSHSSSGSRRSSSNVTPLPALAHVLSQPLAYLYLSQIPYTGLDLGPIGTVLYWIALIGWSLALAYLVLFGAVPVAKRRMSNFGFRVSEALNAREFAPVVAQRSVSVPESQPFQNNVMTPEPPRSYSSYDGFKSYAKNGALSVDDIVKGLSRHHHAGTEYKENAKPNVEPVYEKVEPVFEQVEPIYENVETIVSNATIESGAVQPHIRGFAAALVEGDRVAVFAGLRQHLRGGGVPEHLLSKTVCLIDDVYRSRVDGIACDPDMARMTARLDTPTLEKLVTSLTTAIDSSYSTGVTGAKLALTRALTVLGA